MTEEQKKARKISAESGHIRWIKDNCLRTKDGDDDYVFISYKSDDFEKVLDDIVYNTCQKYGLRVYFDTAFDEDSDSWIMQYYDNMCDPKCKAFVAFLDDAYYSSYACLLEMMSRKTAAAGGDYKKDSLFFLPVNIGSISDIVDNTNTGLGTRRYSNGKTNSHAEEELERFNDIFSEVADDFMRKSIYKREKDTQLYDEATPQSPKYGKMYLNITQCRRLMEQVIPKKNDNDGSNKGFVDVIHDKLINAGIYSVFGKVLIEPQFSVFFKNGESVQQITVKAGEKINEPETPVREQHQFVGWYYTAENTDLKWDFRKNEVHSDLELFAKWKSVSQFNRIALKEFLQKFNNNNFKKDTFSKLRLVGSDGYEKYNTEFHDSAYDLVWEFVMHLLDERGIEFINSVEEKHPGLKNPAFITQDIYEKRNDQKKYRKIEAEGVDNYYMYRHYGQYQWMDTVLKLRMLDFGLPIEKFYIEYVNENEQLIDVTDEIDIEDGENETDSFIYTLWNEPHTANKLASMMHDVFELIAAKYPEKIKEMAEDISITSVALKSDVDEEKLPPNKLNYFKAKKEHKVGDTLYYVSTRYNRKGGIGQLRKMLTLCEGNSDSLKITSSPEKSTRSNNGKTGIGELLD